MRWVRVVAIGLLLSCMHGASARPTDGRTSRVFGDDRLNFGVAVHAVSDDGRWLAFVGTDPDHDPLDPERPTSGLMVRDLQNGIDHLVTPPGLSVTFKGMASDGSEVLFRSVDDIPGAGDTNGEADGFVWQRSTGTLTLVTVSSTGAQGDGSTYAMDLSADGTRVLFESAATNFSPGAGGTAVALYVRDRTAGTTTLVNVLPDGTAGPQPSNPAMSRDGKKVVFSSYTVAYVAGDPAGGAFIRDMATGTITRASVRLDGTADPQVHLLAVDGDGSHVAWSYNGNIKVRNLATGVTTQAEPAAGTLYQLRLSSNARFLTWHTYNERAVMQDLDTGVVRVVSITEGGQEMASGMPVLTADGSRAFFAGAWPPGPVRDAFVHEIGAAPASACPDGGARQGPVSGPLYDVGAAAGADEATEATCDVLVGAGL